MHIYDDIYGYFRPYVVRLQNRLLKFPLLVVVLDIKRHYFFVALHSQKAGPWYLPIHHYQAKESGEKKAKNSTYNPISEFFITKILLQCTALLEEVKTFLYFF